MQLRPYQQQCLHAMVDTAKKGVRRQLVALPTGCGKTVIFSQIPKLAQNRAMLVLAHRTELIQQAADSIKKANPDLDIGIEQAKSQALPEAQVVVASVQTLSVSPKRLAKLDPSQFGVVVVDEAHHAVAKSYIRIFNQFGLAPSPDDIPDRAFQSKELSSKTKALFNTWEIPGGAPYLFGFTATPHRTDGQGLEWVFDEIAFSRTIKEMIREGWLCDVRGVQVETQSDISAVRVIRGEYAESDLEEKVNNKPRNETIVNSFLALASDRQAICFCVNVKHTQDVCDEFAGAGVRTAYVVGETPAEERAQIIAAYKRGDIQVLCNCMVLTEGFDAPETSCIIMARPTKSSLMYTQMLGRGTRLAPDKVDLLVIDLVDIGAAGVSTVNTLFGLPPKLALADVTVTEAEDELEELGNTMALDSEVLAKALTIPEVLATAKAADPLEAAAMPYWLNHKLTWVRTSYGYALNLQRGEQLGLVVNTLGQATIRFKRPYQSPATIGFNPTVQGAVYQAEQWVRDNTDMAKLLTKNAPWHTSTDPATEKQISMLRWLRADIPPGLTKGQASQLINVIKGSRVTV